MSKDPLITDETAFVREALAAEAEAISRLAARAEGPDADAWRSAIELIAECSGHVAVSGMGKSGLIGAKISATLSSLGRPSHALHPAEAVHGDLGRRQRGTRLRRASGRNRTLHIFNVRRGACCTAEAMHTRIWHVYVAAWLL